MTRELEALRVRLHGLNDEQGIKLLAIKSVTARWDLAVFNCEGRSETLLRDTLTHLHDGYFEVRTEAIITAKAHELLRRRLEL